MRVSQMPAHLSFKGRLGYLFAFAGFLGVFNAILQSGRQTMDAGFVVLPSLLLLVGIVLVVQDPYAQVAKWRLLFSNGNIAKSGLGRVGLSLAVGGFFYITVTLDMLLSDPTNGLTSPYWIVAIVAFVVGTFLFLRD